MMPTNTVPDHIHTLHLIRITPSITIQLEFGIWATKLKAI